MLIEVSKLKHFATADFLSLGRSTFRGGFKLSFPALETHVGGSWKQNLETYYIRNFLINTV